MSGRAGMVLIIRVQPSNSGLLLGIFHEVTRMGIYIVNTRAP